MWEMGVNDGIRPYKPRVTGSSPVPPTIFLLTLFPKQSISGISNFGGVVQFG